VTPAARGLGVRPGIFAYLLAIRNFDAIEVHPCCVVGFADVVEFIETCERDDAHFRSVYGYCVTGDLECFKDFPTEAQVEALAARLRRTYPHLVGEVRPLTSHLSFDR
jgi:hypothetical protein